MVAWKFVTRKSDVAIIGCFLRCRHFLQCDEFNPICIDENVVDKSLKILGVIWYLWESILPFFNRSKSSAFLKWFINREQVKEVKFREGWEVESLKQSLTLLDDDPWTNLMDYLKIVVLRILPIHEETSYWIRLDVKITKDDDIVVRFWLLHHSIEKFVGLQELHVLIIRIPKQMRVVDCDKFPWLSLQNQSARGRGL